MASRKDFSKEEIKKIGLRIKSARTLTGLNQEEFCTKYNIPLPSIKTWEFGQVVPRIDGLTNFINYLRLEGIFVDIEWILYAQKTGPSYFLEDIQNQNITSPDQSLFHAWFEKSCKKNKTNPIIFSIADDDMEPSFFKTDLIAGILVNIKSLDINFLHPLIIKNHDDQYLVRYVHPCGGEFFMRSIKNPQLEKIQTNFVGKILWHNFAGN